MAGKMMRLRMTDNIFSMTPVDRKTIANWQKRIDVPVLRAALIQAIHPATAETIWFDYEDPRAIGSYIDAVNDIVVGLPTLTRARLDSFCFQGLTQDTIMSQLVTHAAEPAIDRGLWLLMLINTWRAIIEERVGPIIGFPFNITIPGIVATCMRLNVDVNFD